ncbi:MAG: pentapeptide repeat-containing protein [bacterium]
MKPLHRTAGLTKSNFSGANLEGAILSNAKLENMALTGARLFRVDLRGAKGLDSISAEWIDVGEKGEPVILTGDEIREWLVSTSKDNRKRSHTYSNVKMQAA